MGKVRSQRKQVEGFERLLVQRHHGSDVIRLQPAVGEHSLPDIVEDRLDERIQAQARPEPKEQVERHRHQDGCDVSRRDIKTGSESSR